MTLDRKKFVNILREMEKCRGIVVIDSELDVFGRNLTTTSLLRLSDAVEYARGKGVAISFGIDDAISRLCDMWDEGTDTPESTHLI